MNYNSILFEKIQREIKRGRLPLFEKYCGLGYDDHISYSKLISDCKEQLNQYENELLAELIEEAIKKGKVIPKADIDMLVLDKYEQ